MTIIATFGQARQGTDGFFYNEHGVLFTGISYDYYPDSVIHSEVSLLEGKLDGITRIYFESGQLQEIRSFKKSMMHGKWENWNRQNIKIAEANYTDNKKDGKWFVWDDSGTLRYDMTYVAGKKAGAWYMYDETGKLVSQKVY